MTEAQGDLIRHAKESLEAAKLLHERDFYDFAVSRAYYAMFYIAQAFLLQKELTFSSHSAVIAAFGKHFARTNELPRKFHRYLIDAEDDRLIGDYDANPALTAEDSAERIAQAEEFIALAEEHLSA